MILNHFSDDNSRAILIRLLKEYVKPYLKKLILAVIFMIIAAACSAILVKIVEPIINKVFLEHNKNTLMLLPWIIFAVYTTKGLAEYYQSYLIKYVGQSILTDLQMKMYSHLLQADWQFLQLQSSGKLISRFTNDISLMRGAVSNLLVGCAKHFLTVLFLIIVMFKLEPRLSLVVFIAFPIAIIPVQSLGRRIRKVSALTQEELGNYTSKLDETFNAIRIIKSFSTEEMEANKALTVVKNVMSFYKKVARLDALTSPIMEILCGLAIGGIVWYGGLIIIENQTTPGELFAFITAFVSAYRPFKSLVSLNVNLQEGIAAAKRIFTILDTKQSIIDHKDAKDITLKDTSVNFNNVFLSLSHKNVLQGLSLLVEHGSVTAIIGRSGSGKSSLVNLLVRFYDADSGTITIGQNNIHSLTMQSLRKQIALVTQEIMLFDTTIAENISYGCSDATEEEIINAAKLADADEFIAGMPNNYQSTIGIQGVKLSGGQRQKIAIARAILKNAPIIILDEATSALDQQSEQKILHSLSTLQAQGKTIIIITHRLSSITHVDNIIVMKEGKIIEQGTHNMLMQNKNEYYILYNSKIFNND